MSNNIIWNLMLRDLRAYKWYIVGISIIVLMMGMLMIFLNTNLSRMFASGGSIIFVTIMIPFISELKNRSVWQHTASLPVTRKSIVTARFIVSLTIIALNILLWVGAYHLLMVLLGTDPKYALSSAIIILVSMNLVLNLALFYLVYFRFSLAIAIGIYLFLIIVPSFVQTYLNLNHGLLIENFNQPLVLSISATGMLIISFLCSFSYFNKRDL
jgi:ABC-type transport system involved in multi-copper enzyme maturation permease subunit